MRSNKGITLAVLVITIVVLLIIASISIGTGNKVIKSSELENMITNMLLIEAKALECVEEVNFKLGPNNQKIDEITSIRENVYEYGNDNSAKLKKISELNSERPDITIPSEIPQDETVYWVTEETMQKWGINKIKLLEGEAYLIKFNETEAKVEIYNTLGFNGKYSLTDINEIEI